MGALRSWLARRLVGGSYFVIPAEAGSWLVTHDPGPPDVMVVAAVAEWQGEWGHTLSLRRFNETPDFAQSASVGTFTGTFLG